MQVKSLYNQHRNAGCFFPVLFFGMLVCISACRTPQQLIDKADRKDPIASAKYAREKAPCVDGKVRPGDSTGYNDRQKLIDSVLNAFIPEPPKIIAVTKHDRDSCPDLNKHYEDQQEIIDRLKNQNETLHELLKMPPVPIHDTLPIEDSAKIKIAQAEIDRTKNDLTKYVNLSEVQAAKIDRKNKTIWILIIACLALAGLNILQFKRKG